MSSDGLFTSLAGDLAGPVVDWGIRKAEVEKRKTIVRQRLLEYSKAYLNAIGEVEDALWRERRHLHHRDRDLRGGRLGPVLRAGADHRTL